MSSRMPPVPPENRSPKGPGGDAPGEAPQAGQARDANTRKTDPDKIGQSGNTKVNTTNQGLQQDR